MTRWCTIKVGDVTLGVEVERVVEVVRGASVEAVPLAPRGVKGLMNLRGQLVCALDVGLLLLGVSSDEADTSVVVTQRDGEHIALLVDQVGDVTSLDIDAQRAMPDGVDALTEAISPSVAFGERELIAELDIDALIEQIGKDQ